jgi:hypothetical protein
MEACCEVMQAYVEKMKACQEVTEACLEKRETNQEELEANQEKIEAVAEHCNQAHCLKATHILTTLQGWASDVLHRVSKGVTFKETNGALED